VTNDPDLERGAAAPDVPARRAARAGVRTFAAALLVAGTAAAVWLGSFAWRHRVGAAARDTSPFALSDTVWRSIRAVARTTGPSCPPSVPVAVLYVSRSCVHCEAELQRWAGLVRRGAAELACVAVAVVAPFAQRSAARDWPPPELAQSLLWDRDGVVARALDARLVPIAAFVTATGVVRVRAVGESSEAATIERLRRLRWLSDIESGGRWHEQ
jgi:hypothetical protein